MIETILRKAVEAGASDVHLHAGAPPLFRARTTIEPSEFPTLSAEQCEQIARSLLDQRRWGDFQTRRDADFSYEISGLARFRVNAHFQRNTIALSIRIVDSRVRALGELFLPEIVAKLTAIS